MIELIGVSIAYLIGFIFLLVSLSIPEGGYLFFCTFGSIGAVMMQFKYDISNLAVLGYFVLFTLILSILSNRLQYIFRARV